MYAVVRIAGKQFEVRPRERLRVPRLAAEAGEVVDLDDVLMLAHEPGAEVGTPTVPGARVKARVLGHGRDATILVFHKKRRKDYRKKNGHRQPFSEIEIQAIETAAD